MSTVVEDRKVAVARLSAEDLCGFVAAVPAVAEVLEGRGPLADRTR